MAPDVPAQQEQEAGRLATAKGEVNQHKRASSTTTPSTLADLGIPRDRSARALLHEAQPVQQDRDRVVPSPRAD